MTEATLEIKSKLPTLVAKATTKLTPEESKRLELAIAYSEAFPNAPLDSTAFELALRAGDRKLCEKILKQYSDPKCEAELSPAGIQNIFLAIIKYQDVDFLKTFLEFPEAKSTSLQKKLQEIPKGCYYLFEAICSNKLNLSTAVEAAIQTQSKEFLNLLLLIAVNVENFDRPKPDKYDRPKPEPLKVFQGIILKHDTDAWFVEAMHDTLFGVITSAEPWSKASTPALKHYDPAQVVQELLRLEALNPYAIREYTVKKVRGDDVVEGRMINLLLVFKDKEAIEILLKGIKKADHFLRGWMRPGEEAPSLLELCEVDKDFYQYAWEVLTKCPLTTQEIFEFDCVKKCCRTRDWKLGLPYYYEEKNFNYAIQFIQLKQQLNLMSDEKDRIKLSHKEIAELFGKACGYNNIFKSKELGNFNFSESFLEKFGLDSKNPPYLSSGKRYLLEKIAKVSFDSNGHLSLQGLHELIKVAQDYSDRQEKRSFNFERFYVALSLKIQKEKLPPSSYGVFFVSKSSTPPLIFEEPSFPKEKNDKEMGDGKGWEPRSS
ncbi:MAG: hypothetical protein QM752_00730 [Gammaproteobacteria bacterium]